MLTKDRIRLMLPRIERDGTIGNNRTQSRRHDVRWLCKKAFRVHQMRATADLEGATVTGEFEGNVIQQAAIKDAIEAAGFDVTA